MGKPYRVGNLWRLPSTHRVCIDGIHVELQHHIWLETAPQAEVDPNLEVAEKSEMAATSQPLPAPWPSQHEHLGRYLRRQVGALHALASLR